MEKKVITVCFGELPSCLALKSYDYQSRNILEFKEDNPYKDPDQIVNK